MKRKDAGFSGGNGVLMHGPSDFMGSWQLDRVLTDHAGQMSGTLTGGATFEAAASGSVTYWEQGTLTLATGAQMQAERQYQWRWDAGGVAVSFADGAPFHRFVPAGRSEGTSHLCGADLYDVAYDFAAWPRWEAVWTVKGPRKNYTSRSVYRRA